MSKLDKMRKQVQSGLNKDYKQLLAQTPSIEEFDRISKEEDKPKEEQQPVVRLTGQTDNTDETTQTSKKDQLLIKEILLEDIIPDSNQPRTIFDADALEALKNSIEEHGVQVPIIVKIIAHPDLDANQEPKQPRYQIIAGERRYRAAKSLDLRTIPARILENLSPLDYTLIALTENIVRENLHPLDEAKAYQNLIDSKLIKNQSEISKKLGVDRRRVSERLSLLDLPEDVSKIIFNQNTFDMPITSVLEILRIKQKEKMSGLAKKAIEEQMTSTLIRKEVTRLNIKTDTPSKSIKSSFKPYRKVLLGTKGFDLVVKYRTDRKEDKNVILEALNHIIDELEATAPKEMSG